MSITAAIQVLPTSTCPLAVIRLIVSVIVNAVKRETRRLFAHIGEEVSEVTPAITYFDPTATVTQPMIVVRISAALNHRRPCHVFNASVINERMAMFKANLATTTFRVTTAKIISLSDRLLATITKATPKRFLAPFTCWLKSYQYPETLSGQIKFSCHHSNYNMHVWKRTA